MNSRWSSHCEPVIVDQFSYGIKLFHRFDSTAGGGNPMGGYARMVDVGQNDVVMIVLSPANTIRLRKHLLQAEIRKGDLYSCSG